MSTRSSCKVLLLVSVFFMMMIPKYGLSQPQIGDYNIVIEDKSFPDAVDEVRKQTGYRFDYNHDQFPRTHKVNMNVKHASLDMVLYLLFYGQPVNYRIVDHSVLVRLANDRDSICVRVVDDDRLAMEGVTVEEPLTHTLKRTNKQGVVWICRAPFRLALTLSHVGCLPNVTFINSDTTIQLWRSFQPLDTMSTGYTSQHSSRVTGTQHTIKANELPGNTLTEVLKGPVPRFQAQPVTGVPWSAYKYNMGNSFSLGNDLGGQDNNSPIIVLGKIPLQLDYRSLNKLSGLLGDPSGNGAPYNILSVIPATGVGPTWVLQDAIGSASYGSRGANGVILVNPRKPVSEGYRIRIGASVGQVTALRRIQMMNRGQYNAMRIQALQNDELAINASTAPDVLLPGSQSYDWSRQLYGNTGYSRAAELSIDGNKGSWAWTVDAMYNQKQYVLPVTCYDITRSVMAGVYYNPEGSRFKAKSNFLVSGAANKGPAVDMFPLLFLSPFASDALTSTGLPSWKEQGITVASLNGWSRNTSQSTLQVVLASMDISYRFTKWLDMQLTAGGTQQTMRETATFPLAGKVPNPIWSGYYDYAISRRSNWILEPQLNARWQWQEFSLNAYTGISWQEQQAKSSVRKDEGYETDTALYAAWKRPAFNADDAIVTWPYRSYFGGLTVLYTNAWSANLVVRRDWSSRMGATKYAKNFYALGLAWLFTEQLPVQWTASWLRYGKIRMSYGTTGSDQLVSTAPQQGSLQWPVTQKWEGAVEVGLWRAWSARVGWYQYTNRHQFLEMPETGTSTLMIANYDAKVRNTGLELQVGFKKAFGAHWRMDMEAMVTFPRNRLLSLPGRNAAAGETLLLHQPLSARRVYLSEGPLAGKGFGVKDVDGNGSISYDGDAKGIRNLEILYYGNVVGSFTYKQWALRFDIEIKQQNLLNASWHLFYRQVPGNSIKNLMLNNQPASLVAGMDGASARRFTTKALTMRKDIVQYLSSDEVFTRNLCGILKMAALQYNFSGQWLKKLHTSQASLYVQGDNCFYLNRQNQDLQPMQLQTFASPPARTITVGLRWGLGS